MRIRIDIHENAEEYVISTIPDLVGRSSILIKFERVLLRWKKQKRNKELVIKTFNVMKSSETKKNRKHISKCPPLYMVSDKLFE